MERRGASRALRDKVLVCLRELGRLTFRMSFVGV